MKNFVLCFDRGHTEPGSPAASNARTVFDLLDDSDGQTTWCRDGPRPTVRPRAAIEAARVNVAAAYEFLADRWEPEDRIFLFGVGLGGYCARALTGLLDAVGVLPERSDDLRDYALATYALPGTQRTSHDWQRVSRLAAQLAGSESVTVPVHYLGLWDTVKSPGTPPLSWTAPLSNVVAGRHAVALDGLPFNAPLRDHARLEEVWFRGAHCDVGGGGAGACRELAGIALDWVLDGAFDAGLVVREDFRDTAPAPTQFDALAGGGAHALSLRRAPPDALVHASVDVYLRAHPWYRRRLPDRPVFADDEWLDRREPVTRAEPQTPEPVMAAAS